MRMFTSPLFHLGGLLFTMAGEDDGPGPLVAWNAENSTGRTGGNF